MLFRASDKRFRASELSKSTVQLCVLQQASCQSPSSELAQSLGSGTRLRTNALLICVFTRTEICAEHGTSENISSFFSRAPFIMPDDAFGFYFCAKAFVSLIAALRMKALSD